MALHDKFGVISLAIEKGINVCKCRKAWTSNRKTSKALGQVQFRT
jgi:hypothetical protein